MIKVTNHIILLNCGSFGVWTGGQLCYQEKSPYITQASPTKIQLSFFPAWKQNPLVIDTASGSITSVRAYRWYEEEISELIFQRELEKAGFFRRSATSEIARSALLPRPL